MKGAVWLTELSCPRGVRLPTLSRGELPPLRLDPKNPGSGSLHKGCAGAVSTSPRPGHRSSSGIPG